MALVKSIFRIKADLNSIGDALFTTCAGKLFYRGTTRFQRYFLAMSSLNERVFNLKAFPLMVTELWVVFHIVPRLLSFKSTNVYTILNTIVMSL